MELKRPLIWLVLVKAILCFLLVDSTASPILFEETDSHLNFSYIPTEIPTYLEGKITSTDGKLRLMYVDSLSNQLQHNYTPTSLPSALQELINSTEGKLRVMYADSLTKQLQKSYIPTEPSSELKDSIQSLAAKLRLMYADSLSNQLQHSFDPLEPQSELDGLLKTINGKIRLLYVDSLSNQLEYSYVPTEPSTELKTELNLTQAKIRLLYVDSLSNQFRYFFVPSQPPIQLGNQISSTDGKLRLMYVDSLSNQLQHNYTPTSLPSALQELINSTEGKLRVMYADSLTKQLQKSYIPTEPSSELKDSIQSLAAKLRLMYADSLSNQLQTSFTPESPPEEMLPKNQPPTVFFTFTTSGLTVQFNSQSYDPDGYITSYLWNFGDGYTSTEQNPAHEYRMSGEYVVSLTVKDNDGAVSTYKETIRVESVVEKVEAPKAVAYGLPLDIHVKVRQDANVSVEIGSVFLEKYGNDLTFSIDTSELQPKKYTATISIKSDQEELERINLDVNVYEHNSQELINELENLKATCYEEMCEVSQHVGDQTFDTIVHYKDMFGIETPEVLEKFREEAELLYTILEAYDEDLAGQMDDKTNEFVENLKIIIEYILNPDYILRSAVYKAYFESKYVQIDQRDEEVKGIDIERARQLISIGKEAIRNSEYKPVYRIESGLVKLTPSLSYLYEKNEKAMNCKHFGFIITPWDLADVMWADANAILTIPAYFGIIESTPPEDVGVRVAILPLLIKAIHEYIVWSNRIVDASPAVITAGIHASALWDSDYINGTHYNVIEAIKAEASGDAVYKDEALLLKRGNVVVVVAPDGRIVGFEYVEQDSTMTIQGDYKVIVYGTKPQVFIIGAEETNVSLNISMDKYNFSTGEHVNFSVSLEAEENVTGILFTFVENTTFKEFVNNKNSCIYNYSFVPNSSGIYRIKSYFVVGGERVAEVSKTFKAGVQEARAATLSVRCDKYYDPGNVSIAINIKNTGDLEISPTLTYLNESIQLESIVPGEEFSESITIEILNPGSYEIPFYIKVNDEVLDGDVASFTVRAFDTIFAEPKPDKPVYSLGEKANISVRVHNLTQTLSIPANITVKTPSGGIVCGENGVQLNLTEAGTYIVKASPILPAGYFAVSGDTIFIVDNQSQLVFNYSKMNNTVTIRVKTDAGAVVEGAKVVLGGDTNYTDANGYVSFNVNESLENATIIIEKFGFNPVASTISLREPPVASFTFTPSQPNINELIEFNASPSSSPNGIVEYRWEFGDGNSTIEADPVTTHSYSLPGCYVVNLTVEDSIGLTNQTSRCIAVGCGDVNCDGSVNMGDVIALLYHVGYGSEICSEWAADVNSDGDVNMGDVIKLLYHVGYGEELERSC